MKIFLHANIHTISGKKASAFAVDKGTFIALGSDAEILGKFSGRGRTIDLEGRTVWPGLIDSHVHLQHLAAAQNMVDCETNTIEECLQRVKAKAEQLPPDAWVRGHGWNQNNWENGYGNAELLEAICGGRPAYLTAKSLHAAWVNRTALDRIAIELGSLDPDSDAFQRDNTGEPTGILFEEQGMGLIEKLIPHPTKEELSIQFLDLFPKLWRLGLIGIHDFDGITCWYTLRELHEQQKLGVRVTKNIPFSDFETFIQSGLKTGDGDDWLNIGNLKIFADGSLGPQTAAMSTPYENSKDSGLLQLTEDEIFEIGVMAAQLGIGLSVHAIGDRANHIVLNAFENLRKFETDNSLPRLPHRIEHVQTIQPNDLPRLAALDIIASVQPVHAPSDMTMADKHLGERGRWTYNFKSFIESGAKVVFGSDAPVEPIDPFQGIHAAVTRRRMDGSPGKEGWYPNQRISLSQALMGFSASPAIITQRGDRLGQISQGYRADFLILEEDPFVIDPSDLYQIKPSATFIEGDCVFLNDSFQIK